MYNGYETGADFAYGCVKKKDLERSRRIGVLRRIDPHDKCALHGDRGNCEKGWCIGWREEDMSGKLTANGDREGRDGLRFR